MPSLPFCHALGCSEPSDPRQAIHGPGGRAVPSCESHGMAGVCTGSPCSCPPHDGTAGPVPAWQALQEQLDELHRIRTLAQDVLLT